MVDCPFCAPNILAENIIFENELCIFLQRDEPVLTGSGLIIIRLHKETVFNLSPAEWIATNEMIQNAKNFIDEKYRPDGYNLGWNCGAIAGQEIFHVHLHIIPRYKDEPFAGKGIRHWLKQESNRRNYLQNSVSEF